MDFSLIEGLAPMAIEKIKILGKWAGLPVLFSGKKLQNGSQDFDFFNCYWYRLFICSEFH
jgi:hypothetical protein